MITLFYAYSRSGGTLLNRILAAMPDNVVLSEVLPTNHSGDVIPGIESGSVWHQALYWYDIRLKNKDYIPAILELDAICQRSGRHLIVREWCAGCYPPHTEIFSELNIPPPYGLFALKHLPKKQTRPFALVRHGADTIKSLYPNDHHWSDAAADYAQSYLAYAQDVHESRMPVYDYAELCGRPDEFIEKLCSKQGIPFDKTGLSRFAHIITACGDTSVRGRYANSTTIRPLKRRILSDIAQENLYRNNPDFRRADSLLRLKPDPPLEEGEHTTARKQFKKHKKIPFRAFVTCKPITSPSTVMWRYDDIIDSQRIQAPPLSARLKRHLATIPPDCVVVVLYARYLDSGVINTLQALDDAAGDFPPRAFIIMTRKKRAFLTIPSPLRARTLIHTLKKDTGEMPDCNIETLSLMRALTAHNKHHTLFLCSKHIIITARNILPRLLALCPFHDTATALSYGHTDTGGGIDTHPLIIHSKKNTTSHLGYLPARGAKGTPFADRRILFDPEATNNKPLTTQRQMDFVQRYPEFIRRPFINWTKVYDNEDTLLLLFADHNSVRLATTRTQKIYGILTKIYKDNAPPLSKKEKRFIQRCYRYIQAGPYAKYMYAFYYDERWLRLKRSIKKRLPHVKTLLRIKK